MLEPILSKLRNKELSFGCIIFDGEEYMRYTESNNERGFIHGVFEDGESGGLHNDGEYEIIGHPLTWGRIEYLCWEAANERKYKTGEIKAMQIHPIFDSNPFLYDQNELQRMQNTELWNKLYPLLQQFSTYF